MDLARYRITINPGALTGAAAAKYSRQVLAHLTWIHRTNMGKVLLESIRFHKLPVEIRLYPTSLCNAGGGGEIVGGALRGFASYTPDTFNAHGTCPGLTSSPNRGLYGDEMLFHELIHTFRNVSRKWSQSTLHGGLYRYTDSEEFLAVVLTNIYISDPTNRIKSGLRADHRGFRPLESEFGSAFGLFSASTLVFGLVKQFVTDNHGFASMTANVKAPFNPIADYYASPERAQQLSRDARPRDLRGIWMQLTAQ